MSIVNRSLAPGFQKEQFSSKAFSTTTGASAAQQTIQLWIAPFPCQLLFAKQSVNGISGTPLHNLGVYRMVVGAGVSTIVGLNSSFAVSAVSTSGPQGFSLVAAGSTLLKLQTNDILVMTADGQDSAVSSCVVTAVVQKIQDIVTYYGS